MDDNFRNSLSLASEMMEIAEGYSLPNTATAAAMVLAYCCCADIGAKSADDASAKMREICGRLDPWVSGTFGMVKERKAFVGK